MIDDGSLSGMVVICPACSNQFTMPASQIPAPPQIGMPVQPFAPGAFPQIQEFRYGVGGKVRNTTKHGFGGAFGVTTGVGLGCMAVAAVSIVVMVVLFIFLGVIATVGNRAIAPSPRSDPYEQDYRQQAPRRR